MPQIVVDDDQAKIISDSASDVEICDRNGVHLGYVAHGFTDKDIAIAKRRMASEETRFVTLFVTPANPAI